MRIVTRDEWGARHARGSGPAPLPAMSLWLHHTAGPLTQSIRDLEAVGQARFGAGISYTFLVRSDGTIYEGHGIDRRGAHTRGLNSTARAICAIGNYETTTPTAALLDAIAWLVRHGHAQGWWPERITGGHRDAPGASTACPGTRLQARIPSINRAATSGTPPPPPPPPPKGLTVSDVQAIRTDISNVGRGVIQTKALVDLLRAELLDPVGSDGQTRADRMAAIPARLDALDKRLDRIEAAIAALARG